MSTGYRIKDVAQRSGFSAPTLRYYEEIGLLPTPERTPSGYRVYDDQTLARLAFITRAKQLGCSLAEIADLTSAWEGGRCGPVQDRLRTVVAEKRARAQDQLMELVALTAELHQAAVALERHRPEGACDVRCGCVSDVAVEGEPAVRGRALAVNRAGESEVPIACTLGAGAMRGRVEEWQALLAHVTRREEIPDGVRLVFEPPTPFEQVLRLAVVEQDCCEFFAFTITVDTRGIALEVSAPAEALPIVQSMFGSAA